jgi:chromosome segregation ATPase
MANTEIRKILQHIRSAQKEVASALDKPGLSKPRRELLGDTADSLRELDDLLVIVDLNESINDLEEKSTKIQAINERVQKEINDLKEVAQTVDAVAKGVDALVKAFGILVSARLV